METPAARVRRLTLALEDLLQQQNFLLDSGEPEAALEIQQRCVPLVEDIARTMMGHGVARSLDADTQTRAQRLIASQLAQQEKVSAQKAALRDELTQIAAAQGRTSRFRHTYQNGLGRQGSSLNGEA